MNSKFFFQQIKLYKSLAFLLLFGVFFQVGLNAQGYDVLGQEHNRALRYLLPRLNSTMDRNTIISTSIPILNEILTAEEMNNVNDLYQFTSVEDYLAYLNGYGSLGLNQAVNRVLNMLQSNLTVNQIWNEVAIESANAYVIPNPTERENFQKFLSLIKWSAKFWLPGDRGGESGFNLIGTANGGTQPPPPQAMNWWKVLGCDALGAVVGGMVGGPVGSAGSAAISSGCSIINQM